MFAKTCQAENETEEICISWLKPNGGNEIDNYIVKWIIIEDNLNHSDTIPYNGMESDNYTIINLQPAKAVKVSIQASNCAGEGDASTKTYATGKSFTFSKIFFVILLLFSMSIFV